MAVIILGSIFLLIIIVFLFCSLRLASLCDRNDD